MTTFLTRIYVASMCCVFCYTIGLAEQGSNNPPGSPNVVSQELGWFPVTVLPPDIRISRLDQEHQFQFDPVVIATTYSHDSVGETQNPSQAEQQEDDLFDLGFHALLDTLDRCEQPTADAEPDPAPLDRFGTVPTELDGMVQRIDELETIIQANEDATRTIIRQTFAEKGSKINDSVIFGGTFELLTEWEEDFEGDRASDIVTDTAQLDFEIQVNRWTLGSLIFEYDDGTNLLFPTTTGNNAAVDRINVDTAFITIGDTQKFFLYTTLGRVITPFGISTGAAKGQVLNLIDPLTVEVFETRQDVILIGFEGPTPPPPPPVSTTPVPPPPKVKPLVFNPLVSRFSRRLGYRPPPPPRPPAPVPAPYVPKRLPYKGEIYVYNGQTIDQGGDHIEHVGGMLGYRTEGRFRHCLPIISPVPNSPWSMDYQLNVVSSVFDSRFLEFEYLEFLDQIGYVPGLAAHVSSAFGPLSLIAEWNGAVSSANFSDDLGRTVSMTPGAWQVSMGYQFDWNPSVNEIGAQGTYFALGYSETYDLAGVTQLTDEAVRVGSVPEKRFVVGMGEWVLDGLRVALEYSHIVDYPVGEGLGTGRRANGMFGAVTYEW